LGGKWRHTPLESMVLVEDSQPIETHMEVVAAKMRGGDLDATASKRWQRPAGDRDDTIRVPNMPAIQNKSLACRRHNHAHTREIVKMECPGCDPKVGEPHPLVSFHPQLG